MTDGVVAAQAPEVRVLAAKMRTRMGAQPIEGRGSFVLACVKQRQNEFLQLCVVVVKKVVSQV